MMQIIHWGRCFAVISAVLSCSLVGAASGDADPQFGAGGIALVDFTVLTGAPGNTYNASTTVDATGRTWAAVTVVGATNSGLGLARLTRDGQLDGSFGTAGRVFVPAPSLSSFSLIGLRIGADGKAYVAYSQGNGAYASWYVCRIAANGSFDSSFFGGCAGASPANGAVAHDLLISPSDGNVWVLGTAQDPSSHLYEPAVAEFDVTFDVIRTATFPVMGANIDAVAGTMDRLGSLYFTGGYTTASNNTDAVIGYIHGTGNQFTYQLLNIIAFDVGGTLADVGRCIVVTPDYGLLIGVAVDSGYDGIEWGSAKMLLSPGDPLDSTYGTGGKEVHLIADPELGRGNGNYSINGCQLGRDGALNMVGSYAFTDPVPNAPARAVTLYRLLPDGTPDAGFGGASAVPGVFYTLAYPGAVLDFLRPLSSTRPLYDSGLSISAVLPNTGSMIVGGVSRRADGTTNGDLAVMRVLGDDIFNSGFE
ncbi:hypothetical protein [Dokdonella soli]|uniref:Uncharacterized protein n=1 Tax=Dokdonella soli TaxID=529810 RepID=A0ABN1IEZ0_9GAMM